MLARVSRASESVLLIANCFSGRENLLSCPVTYQERYFSLRCGVNSEKCETWTQRVKRCLSQKLVSFDRWVPSVYGINEFQTAEIDFCYSAFLLPSKYLSIFARPKTTMATGWFSRFARSIRL